VPTYAVQDAAALVTAALGEGRPLRVLGAEGSLRGLLLAAAARSEHPGPVVFIAPDDATARTVASDTAFFLGEETEAGLTPLDDPILVVPEIDVSPYADLSPDPRVVGSRLAALYRLGSHRTELGIAPPRVVIASLRALVRRTIFVRPSASGSLLAWRSLGFSQLAYKDANSRYRPGEENDGWAVAAAPSTAGRARSGP